MVMARVFISLCMFVFLLPIMGGDRETITNADPIGSAATRCPRDLAPYPFSGLYLCDMFNLSCASVSSVFTWYANDSSVDAGYERARGIFAPIGWRDFYTLQEERPSTYDYLSVMPPLHMVPIWEQIHKAHHSAIAYAEFDVKNWLSVTQFEYLPQQIDHNGIPYSGTIPIRARQWMVLVDQGEDIDGVPGDVFQRVTSIVTWEGHQGEIIDSAGNSAFHGKHPVVKVPDVKQSSQQRWSCQGFYRRFGGK